MTKSSERICFIINPSAGRSGALKKSKWLKKHVDERWLHYEIKIPSSPAELASLAAEASESFDTIVACGGDGTAHLVINSIPDIGGCRIGVIPMGSGNDFATALCLPSDPLACLEIIRAGKTKQIDLLNITGDAEIRCLNTFGVGLDGWANYYASTVKKLRGQLVYVYGILKAVFNFRGSMMKLRVLPADALSAEAGNSEEHMEKQILMITLCNGPEEGGGFKVSPEADNSDGCLNVLIIDKLRVARVLWYLPKFLFQPGKQLKGVGRLKCKELMIESEQSVAVHCDGEYMGSHIKKIHAVVDPGCLRAIVP